MKVSEPVRAEAAMWVARLQGQNRTREAEAGFYRWLGESTEHAAAFELLTETWERSAQVKRRPIEQVKSWEVVGFRMTFSRIALATAASALLAVIGTLLYLKSDGLATAVGEQRTLALADGSRVYLNTDSRVVVQFDGRQRRVELARGEALFQVAKEAKRPFVVTAGRSQVLALGTAFIVRRDKEKLAVTLVEGKVSVSESKPDAPMVLKPGQRLTLAKGVSPAVDRPPLERVLAWQRGQISLDDTPLAEAAADMNRYSSVRIVFADPQLAAIRISGIFRAGDAASFAQAMSKSYGLEVRSSPEEIVLAFPPGH